MGTKSEVGREVYRYERLGKKEIVPDLLAIRPIIIPGENRQELEPKPSSYLPVGA